MQVASSRYDSIASFLSSWPIADGYEGALGQLHLLAIQPFELLPGLELPESAIGYGGPQAQRPQPY